MAKAKKIDVKNIILNENTDNTLVVKGFEDTEVEFNNLTEQIKEMIALNFPLNIKITKAPKKSNKPSTKKPIFKMECKSCGKKIKTNEENLQIECVECKTLYILEEES